MFAWIPMSKGLRQTCIIYIYHLGLAGYRQSFLAVTFSTCHETLISRFQQRAFNKWCTPLMMKWWMNNNATGHNNLYVHLKHEKQSRRPYFHLLLINAHRHHSDLHNHHEVGKWRIFRVLFIYVGVKINHRHVVILLIKL